METRSDRADGFTVVEVVVAMTILVIALLGAALMFENAISVSGNTRQRVVGAQLATRQLEIARGKAADPTQFPTIAVGQTVYAGTAQKVNGIQFTVTEDVQWVGQRSTQSSCDSPGNNNGQIMQVTESVTWVAMGGTKPVQQTTALAPPVGAYSSATGSIAVKVFDSNSALSQNINVKVAGPVTQTQQTTAEGCAFFAFLDPGAYTVSVIEGTGVGDQEVLTPAQNTSVSIGQTASIQFNYDKAATINSTGWSNSTATPATGLQISVANTGLQPYGLYSFGANITSLTPLFPYASGYTVFAGACTDSNPLGKDNHGTAFYPTAAPTPLNVDPAVTSTTSVPLYSLAVIVKNGSGTVQNGATVSGTPPSTLPFPNTIACTQGTANATPSAIGLVSTDATGNSVTAVPLGHYKITAVKGTKSGSVNVWVKPDGVYATDASGNATTIYSAPILITVS